MSAPPHVAFLGRELEWRGVQGTGAHQPKQESVVIPDVIADGLKSDRGVAAEDAPENF